MTTKYFVAPKEAVRTLPDGREVCNLRFSKGKQTYSDRTYRMGERQGHLCAMCREPFTHYRIATFDHEDGRGMNGSHRDDRIEVDGQWKNAALCIPCQGIKGSKRYGWQDDKYVPMSA